MQLASFIELAREKILAESVAYARTIMSLKDDDEVVLRDHLPKVLEAISADLRTAQTKTESILGNAAASTQERLPEPTDYTARAAG